MENLKRKNNKGQHISRKRISKIIIEKCYCQHFIKDQIVFMRKAEVGNV